MDHINTGTLWFVIIALGLGSFGLRFVFTGLVGDREMPAWLLRHLRYTAVAILPALVASSADLRVVRRFGRDFGLRDTTVLSSSNPLKMRENILKQRSGS